MTQINFQKLRIEKPTLTMDGENVLRLRIPLVVEVDRETAHEMIDELAEVLGQPVNVEITSCQGELRLDR